MSAARAFAAGALLLAARASAGEPPTTHPDLGGAPVREIKVVRDNVFDPAVPGEDAWLFRAANKLHILTREPIVRRELLFAPGDPWDPLLVVQTERNLRSNGSFRWAEITHSTRADGGVDALVRTQDSWTTNPRVGLGTEGGEHFFSYGLEEGNFLGYGKRVLYDHSETSRRRVDAYGYGDPRFLGTRLALDLGFVEASDGDSGAASLSKPFFALDSESAMSVASTQGLGETVLRRDGRDFTKFRSRRRVNEASLGARAAQTGLFTHRVEAGWYSEKAAFEPTRETVAGTLPADRELNGPTLGWSWVQPRYVKETFVDRMERVEDFNLGNELATRAGWMADALGSDRDRLAFYAHDQQGLSLAPGRFLIGRAAIQGRTAGGRWENGLITGDLNGFWRNEWPWPNLWVGHAEFATGRYLDRENQLVLGGATGLRGYKNDAFVGGKSILVNLENRFFFDREWFHLVRLGGAVFLDTGTIEPEGRRLSIGRFKSDLGAGLRAASTRSKSGVVGRFDFAYALNAGPGSRWVISVRAGQAFSLFNSASGQVAGSPKSRLY